MAIGYGGGAGPTGSPALPPSSTAAASARRTPHVPKGSGSSSGSTIRSNIYVRYDNVHAGALSVDASGSYAVLAGRKGLHLVDLESPYAPACTLHHQTRWDVTVVKCNPHVAGHVASTSNHNTLIWNIAGALNGSNNGTLPFQATSQPLIATLRAHTRPVSDLSWSPAEPTILATCSADTKTHVWDLRTPQRPVQTLCAFTTSATQVEWNRVDQTSLATAHDGDVRIWDTRAVDRGAPAVTITAHMQKIYGLDWHPERMYELLTCSEDKTVKFWNVTQPRVCQGVVPMSAPVWRARYTPFGDGIVTIAQRADPTLRLWALAHGADGMVADPVHTFAGHTDLVKGFVWRARPNSGIYQLVSWSKSQELRMWRVDSQQLQACGYDTTPYSERSPMEPSQRRQMEVSHLQLASKYELSSLKSDFMPLVVPSSAVPISATEYRVDGVTSSVRGSATLSALLAFEDDVVKPTSEAEVTSDEEGSGSDTLPKALNGVGTGDDTPANPSNTRARALPCPRISGACFSGPNILVVFDSRVAIGQTRSSTVVATAVAAGKAAKQPPPVNKLPRTYNELLEMRDSRFATKKNKKQTKLRASSTLGGNSGGPGGGLLGAMDLASDWGQLDAMDSMMFSSEMVDNNQDYRNSGLYYPPPLEPGNSGVGSETMERSIHGGSEYLKSYFTSSDYPYRTGGSLSPPRGPGFRSGSGDRSKRVDQAPAPPSTTFNLDLSLSVTLLDLSRLCGVSSVLMHATKFDSSAARSEANGQAQGSTVMPSGSRSMLSWMLERSKQLDSSAAQTSRNHHLSHILQSLLASQPNAHATADETERKSAVEDEAVSSTCAFNARMAALAGRTDLQKVWSLLEITTASSVEMPPYTTQNQATAASSKLVTSPPWSAHPFGKRLVQKVLNMYEQVGDLPALGSIVCTLQNPAVEDQDAQSSEDYEMVNGNGTDRNSNLSSMRAFGSDTVGSETISIMKSSELLTRARFSTNTLSSLAGVDSSDMPPAMRNTRRSSSQNEMFRGIDAKSPRAAGGRDWTSKTMTAPGATRALSPSTSSNASTWKMDFEKLENPFKTWSNSRDASPKKLSVDTFRRPSEAELSSGAAAQAMSPHGVRAVESSTEDVQMDNNLTIELHMNPQSEEACLLSREPDDEDRYDVYKQSYADMLYRYGAMTLRNDVMKTVANTDSEHDGITFGLLCHSCLTVR